GEVVLHADAIAQNGAPTVWTGRINGDNSDRTIFPPVVFRQLVHQGTFAGAGSPGKAQDAGPAAVGKQRLEQVVPSITVVLHRADGPCQGARIACAQAINPGLDVGVQPISVKQAESRGKCGEATVGGQSDFHS